MLKLTNLGLNKATPHSFCSIIEHCPVYNVGAYRRRPRMPWESDKEQYNIRMHEYRLKAIKDFWERQTLVENEFIGILSPSFASNISRS